LLHVAERQQPTPDAPHVASLWQRAAQKFLPALSEKQSPGPLLSSEHVTLPSHPFPVTPSFGRQT
jgi:hypothetical protein